jgi:signal peptidase II
VFNVADMAISSGIGLLIVFNKKAFHQEEEELEAPVFVENE